MSVMVTSSSLDLQIFRLLNVAVIIVNIVYSDETWSLIEVYNVCKLHCGMLLGVNGNLSDSIP